MAALTKGDFFIKGDLAAEDIQLMIGAMLKMGIRVIKEIAGIRIDNDLGWMDDERELVLDLGNSGTSIRFLSSLVLFRKGTTVLTGKQRMKERPIKDLVDALRQIGAEISYLEKDGFPPICVVGLKNRKGGPVKIKGDVSSQFLSSLMLISSQFEKGLNIDVDGDLISKPYVDLTTALINEWGIGRDFEIEGDASAATYWWVLAYLHDCVINVQNVQNVSKQGDVRFQEVLNMLKKSLGPFEIDMNDMPDASLTLMAVAPFHEFPVLIKNIGSLRVKETDRIQAMANELTKVRVKVDVGTDWVRVWPLQASAGIVKINTYDDHRVAMSMAILGTKLGNLEIMDPDCVNKSYPGFWEELSRFSK